MPILSVLFTTPDLFWQPLSYAKFLCQGSWSTVVIKSHDQIHSAMRLGPPMTTQLWTDIRKLPRNVRSGETGTGLAQSKPYQRQRGCLQALGSLLHASQ